MEELSVTNENITNN